jgi:methionine biosynthesis protein MetW
MLYDRDVKMRALESIEKSGPAPVHLQIAEMAPANSDVLELGCATGYVSKLLKEKGCRIIGIELDAEAAERARRHCDKVITGDAGDLGLLLSAGGPFDCILCGDILEHLSDPPSVMKALIGMLKPQGYLLASLPNIAYWKMRWDLLRGRFDYEETGLLDWTHLRFFTVRTFRQMAEACGYDISQTVISDAGFPGSRILSRMPGLRPLIAKLAFTAASALPNLFAFHSIYRLDPKSLTQSGGGN